jgi:coatomer subunit beta'
LICADSTFILTVKYDVIEEYIENTVDGGNKSNNNESGCEEGFDVDYDINDMIMSGLFIGDVFVYQNIKKKINYAINGKTFSISTLSNNFYMLGYLPSTNKLYFLNKQFQLTSYDFPEAFAYYQMAILEKNIDKANKLFKNIPEVFLEKVIVFLEKFGYNEISYTLTKNQNQKFSLALKLKKLNDAWEIALKESNNEKMKMVADLAFELGEFSFGENAMLKANDLNGLLLYYSAIQNKSKLLSLAENAKDKGKFNIAFAAYYQLNDLNNCLQLLINTKRYPEAALFCRTYCPTKLDQVLTAWNDVLEKNDENNRMITKVVNPLKEENKDVFEKCEKYNDEFYKRVSNGKNEDIDSFSNYFGIDLFNKVSKGEDINMDSILEQ